MERSWILVAVAWAVAAGAACDADDGSGGSSAAGGSTASGGAGGGVPVITCGSSELFAAVHDGCAPAQAAPSGPCHCMLGYAWDGSSCEAITGCECRGTDCDKLSQTPEQCAASHSSCGAISGFECGSDALHAVDHSECVAMDAGAAGDCYCMLGYAFDGTDCVPLAGCECTGADCDKLAVTLDECVAQHAGCSVEPPDFACGSLALYAHPHEQCAAMDVEAIDPCWCMLGYAWDGSACVMLGGCECGGADCDKLFEAEEDCLAAHAEC